MACSLLLLQYVLLFEQTTSGVVADAKHLTRYSLPGVVPPLTTHNTQAQLVKPRFARSRGFPEINPSTIMHLLHRSSMFSGDGGGRVLRRVGSSPQAPPTTTTRHTLSRSESIKKKSGAAKRSKRARLRAGLAAALQELRLTGRKQHGARGRGAGAAAADVVSAGAARPRTSDDVRGRGGCCAAGAAAAPLHVCGGAEAQASRGAGAVAGGGRRVKNAAGGWPPLLALACVVALGRAAAVCCCTCAAWLCHGPRPLRGSASASTDRRHRSSETSAAAR